MPLLPRVRTMINRVRVLPKALAHAEAGAVRQKIVGALRWRVRRLKVKTFKLKLRLTDKITGAKAGNITFWRANPAYDWSAVDARIQLLNETYPNAIAHFTEVSVATARNSEVLINLARSELTKETMRACLMNETLDEQSSVRQRMMRSQMTCAGFVIAATLLLPDKLSAEFAQKATEFCPAFSAHFRRMMDSGGTVISKRPKHDARRFMPHSKFRADRKHRLILAQSLKDVPTLSLLFSGAENVTVFILDDLYGRAEFSDKMEHAGSARVTVEHSRSRITRFSPDYHRVHEDTRVVAQTLTAALEQAGGAELTIRDPQGTELALADNLFFPCLQFAALEHLVNSDEFDHIVVAFGGQKTAKPGANKQFARLLSGIKKLATDPRVEMVCLSPDSQTLETLDVVLKILTSPPPPAPVVINPAKKQELAPAVAGLSGRNSTLAKGFASWPDTQHPRMMLATTQVAAYNRSSAAYSDSISAIANLRIAFLGGNLLSFTESLDAENGSEMVTAMPQRIHASLNPLHKWLVEFLGEQLKNIAPDYVSHVISGRVSDIARNGILAYLAHANLCHVWFARLEEANQLPEAVVLTPFRSPRVTAFAAVARHYNVPSVAIEPHGLNAAYCRYCKVTADYYGVVSRFFVQAAVDGFGMSADRCPVIGSPRLKGPEKYDMAAKTFAARAHLIDEFESDLVQDVPLISYFTQPTDWNQISEVWRIVLEATADLNCQLVLKTHPEETASRVAAYLSIAEELGVLDRVRMVETDAVSLIEASDLVLSGYSATVVEAALYRRPVFCVTNGDIEYPLNQHEIVGGKLLRSTPDLRNEIEAFLKDASPYHRAAETFLENEPQLTQGFEEHLSTLLKNIMSMPREESLRPSKERPQSLFIDGPHTTYKV